MRVRWVQGSLMVLLTLSTGCGGQSGFDLRELFSFGAPLDQATVAGGLRQALDVGMQRTTASLSSPGGFGANPQHRITLPAELDALAVALRGVGLGARVDALEDSMNLAAEEAAAKAVPVFSSAIASMSIADAFAILNGPDDAATVYLEEQTSASLRREFSPIVSAAMREVGLYRAYREAVARYDAIPFSRLPKIDLEDYVTDQTLDALFAELAKEEGRIREDPEARTTALLRRVFGTVSSPPATSTPAGEVSEGTR
jgi:Protein of unknown function (DUF4197)